MQSAFSLLEFGLLLAEYTLLRGALPIGFSSAVVQVYVTLTAALFVSAAGVLTSFALGGFGGWIAALGFIGCALGLMSVEPTVYNLNKRHAHYTQLQQYGFQGILLLVLVARSPC